MQTLNIRPILPPKCPNGNTCGPHKVYAIYDSPACGNTNFTVSNIGNAVGKALNENTEAGMASKANDNTGDNVYKGDNCVNQWGSSKNRNR